MALTVEHLTKKFDDKVILDDISFTVNTGEILAIVGFSGSGKSTILKLISGLLEPTSGKITQDTDGDIAMVFQYSALFDSLNVFDNITFALQERKEFKGKYTQEQLKTMVAQKLKTVGLSNIEKKYPYELSGGMRQRVAIAAALACDAKIIIADEPTTALDVTVQAQIIQLLNEIKNEYQTSVILISHDLALVCENADETAVMYAGSIVEFCKGKEIFFTPKHPYTQGLINSLPNPYKDFLKTIQGTPPSIRDEFAGCPFAPRCEKKLEICDKQKPVLKQISDVSTVACHLYNQ